MNHIVPNQSNPADFVTVRVRIKPKDGQRYVHLDIGEDKGSRHVWLKPSEALKVARLLRDEAGKL